MIQMTQETKSGWCVLSVRGRADAEASDALEDGLRAVLEQSTKVAADFSALDYISSAGLRAVIQAARAAQALKVEFAVFALTPPVKKVFDLSGMDKILTVYGELPC
jgi:anti-sigma B factor antagonist